MRSFTQKSNVNQQTATRSIGQSHLKGILHPQRTIGHQSAGPPLHASSAPLEAIADAVAFAGSNDFFGALAKSQSSLAVSSPGDIHEEEADRVSDQVMRMSQPGRVCPCGGACPTCQTKPVALKSAGTPAATPALEGQLHSSRGEGHPLPSETLGFMEQAFGADFSAVRVHVDHRAEQMNQELNARAFTHGSHIYFDRGQYQPSSSAGKHLLAHELTHVMQQSADRPQVFRSPNPAPPPAPYIPGRPAHNHPALGVWASVQANAVRVCARESIIPFPLPIPIPLTTLGRAECACAAMTPLQVLALARTLEMAGQPLAIRHLDHYTTGGGADFVEHTNLDDLMNTDAGARGVIARAIGVADRGNVFIHQSDYSSDNFKLAFGGIDRVDYQVDRVANTVDVWFRDRYDFHPAGFGHVNMGTGDSAPPGRVTNCVHLAAVEAKSSGAADYWMFGHATLPLSLFTAGPAPSPPAGTL